MDIMRKGEQEGIQNSQEESSQGGRRQRNLG